MTAFRTRMTIYAIVIGLVCGLIIQSFFLASLALEPASLIVSAKDYKIRTMSGALVRIDFSADKPRECITQTSRWLWRDLASKREVIELSYAAMAFGHDIPGTHRDYRFMFEIPATLPSGQWNLRTLHADYCWPWSWVLGPRIRASPPVGLTVMP